MYVHHSQDNNKLWKVIATNGMTEIEGKPIINASPYGTVTMTRLSHHFPMRMVYYNNYKRVEDVLIKIYGRDETETRENENNK